MSDHALNFTRFRATIQYDGTDFHGSQLQPEVRTVQGELESALSKLLDRETRVDFAGRTDAGVHAVGQEIAFDAASSWAPPALLKGLRALTPDDISVALPRDGDEGFHPRFDAERRRYIYMVAPGDVGHGPFLRRGVWRTDRDSGPRLTGFASDDLIKTLTGLAGGIVGQRDFSSFAKTGQPERGTVCDVSRAAWRADARGLLLFEIEADRFLHHMVRYLVGTMVEIAAERRPVDDMAVLLAHGAPTRPVFPAPPNGLYLTGVRYAGEWNRSDPLPW